VSQTQLHTLKAERVTNNWESKRMRSPKFWKQYCRELEMFDIIPIVTKVTGYTLGQLRSHARNRSKVEARQLFVLLCLEHTPHSFVQMGITLNRDHSSVVWLSARKHSDAFKEIWEKACEEIDTLKEKEFGPEIY